MTLSIPLLCSSCPSSNPAGPAPMIAAFVRNTCSPEHYRLQRQPAAARPHQLAMGNISYNDKRKGPLKARFREGDNGHEENVLGAIAGRQCDACVSPVKDF